MTIDQPPSVAVTYSAPVDARGAKHLAARLDVPCVEPQTAPGADLWLMMGGGVLTLRDNRHQDLKPLRIDFEAPESRSKKQLLGRAIGRRTRTVADATAGWGEDARRLCAMGLAVTAIERNGVLAALLADAARRAREAGIQRVPDIIEADAIGYLAARPGSWECVYLDPMFPPKRRVSALARRPLRLLRELAGDDPDKHQLFAAAWTAATRRVVVKRPDRSTPMFGEPTETMKGKLVCYDVYHVI